MINTPTVLITGASRGLGRSMAVAFAKNGFAVGINYSQNKSEAEKTKKMVEVEKVPALLLKADVRSSSEVNSMIDTIKKEWGRIDVLVNNAGIARDNTIAKMTDEEWRDVMAVNLDGVFYCTRAVLPLMREKKEGCIINVTSYAATRGLRGAANYAVSKAGVITLTKNTALEEGLHNIRANVVMPGYHVTDLNRRVWEKYEKVIRDQHLLKNMPEADSLGEFVVNISKLKTVTGQVFSFESRLV